MNYDPDQMRPMTTAEAAEAMHMSASYLNKLRLVGGGPTFIKVGSKVLYEFNDLVLWLSGQKRQSTSSRGKAA